MTIGIFFDTEFTTLDACGFPALISAGFIADNGQEFYAELIDGWNKGMCSPFVVEVVLPLLQGGECRMFEAQLSIRLMEWIESFGGEVVLRSDAPSYDWPWIAEIFQFHGTWPRNLRRKCGYVYFRHSRHQNRYEKALEDYWMLHNVRRHHSLVDAGSLHYAWHRTVRAESFANGVET